MTVLLPQEGAGNGTNANTNAANAANVVIAPNPPKTT
jgi:hypothetical protein